MLKLEIQTSKKYPKIFIHTPFQIIRFYRILLFLVWFGVLFFSIIASIEYAINYYHLPIIILKKTKFLREVPKTSLSDVIVLWTITGIFYIAIWNLSSSFVMIITRKKFVFGRKTGFFIFPIKRIPKNKLKEIDFLIEPAKYEQHVYLEVKTDKSKVLFFLFSTPGKVMPPELMNNLTEIVEKLNQIIEKAKREENIL